MEGKPGSPPVRPGKAALFFSLQTPIRMKPSFSASAVALVRRGPRENWERSCLNHAMFYRSLGWGSTTTPATWSCVLRGRPHANIWSSYLALTTKDYNSPYSHNPDNKGTVRKRKQTILAEGIGPGTQNSLKLINSSHILKQTQTAAKVFLSQKCCQEMINLFISHYQ